MTISTILITDYVEFGVYPRLLYAETLPHFARDKIGRRLCRHKGNSDVSWITKSRRAIYEANRNSTCGADFTKITLHEQALANDGPLIVTKFQYSWTSLTAMVKPTDALLDVLLILLPLFLLLCCLVYELLLSRRPVAVYCGGK